MAKILCVEDEADIRSDIVEELQDAGYETIEASDGKEGLEAIKKHEPNLVLCDITMPVMNGQELMLTLRRNHPEFAEMPFVFLTALAERKDIVAGRRLGADDYLTKPIDYEMLLATVESRLEQVSRMISLKQEQLVKLYNSLLPPHNPNEVEIEFPEIMTVVAVVNDEVDIGEIKESLESLGHVVIRMDSGRAFLDTLDNLAPDLLLASYNTTDIQAPMMVKMMKQTRDIGFPVVLLIPPYMATNPGLGQMSEFDDHIILPFDHGSMMKKIELLTMGWTKTDDVDFLAAAGGEALQMRET